MPSQPVIFHPGYDIRLMGLEKLHPFDTCKYGHVFGLLVERGLLSGQDHYVPSGPVSDLELLKVHTPRYLESLESASTIAAIAEQRALALVPAHLLRTHLLGPMRLATTGTLLGVEVALQHGLALNLSGGYHHAKADSASGFCYFGDIHLAALRLWELKPQARLLIVDLDAHQGNGFEHSMGHDPRLAILDVYNGDIYPGDREAEQFITHNYPLVVGTGTEDYLSVVRHALPKAMREHRPDFILYNAGTDVYEKDELGLLQVSREGIMQRDAFVFEQARSAQVPILAVLSGGYTQESAGIIADSFGAVLRAYSA